MKSTQTKRVTVSAVMLALSTVLALVCAFFLPFLRLPMGGSFTLASMLPIVIVSYMFGVKWGLCTSFAYALIQIIMDLCMGVSGSAIMVLFMPSSDEYMGMVAAVSILVIDYLIAYTVLGFGGLFRNRFGKTRALCVGSIVALSLRYLAHIVSGYIFYGAWAEWFFSQEGWFSGLGAWLIEHFSGNALAQTLRNGAGTFQMAVAADTNGYFHGSFLSIIMWNGCFWLSKDS